MDTPKHLNSKTRHQDKDGKSPQKNTGMMLVKDHITFSSAFASGSNDAVNVTDSGVVVARINKMKRKRMSSFVPGEVTTEVVGAVGKLSAP